MCVINLNLGYKSILTRHVSDYKFGLLITAFCVGQGGKYKSFNWNGITPIRHAINHRPRRPHSYSSGCPVVRVSGCHPRRNTIRPRQWESGQSGYLAVSHDYWLHRCKCKDPVGATASRPPPTAVIVPTAVTHSHAVAVMPSRTASQMCCHDLRAIVPFGKIPFPFGSYFHVFQTVYHLFWHQRLNIEVHIK